MNDHVNHPAYYPVCEPAYDKNENIIKLRKYNRQTRYRKFDDICIASIINHVSINSFINVKKIKKLLLPFGSVPYNKHKIHVNSNYIYKILKDNNFTCKKVQKYKYPYDKEKLDQQVKKLQEEIKQVNNDYISLDETGIVIKTIRDYGWRECLWKKMPY